MDDLYDLTCHTTMFRYRRVFPTFLCIGYEYLTTRYQSVRTSYGKMFMFLSTDYHAFNYSITRNMFAVSDPNNLLILSGFAQQC